MMLRIAAAVYGVLCYVVFFATFLYAIAFVGNIRVPRSIDAGPQAPLVTALVIDAVLLTIFAVQHSVMARQWFKRAWTKVVPAVIERSTYVLFASLALILLFWQWRPITTTIWDVQTPAYATMLRVAFAAGWAIVLISTFLISHFELFGLSQVYAYFSGRPLEPLTFGTPFFYKAVRHPIYLGFMIAFWAAPHMTAGHAFFAFMSSAYMLVAIQFEEHDLIKMYGDRYRQYRREVSMILPIKRQPKEAQSGAHRAGK